VALVAVSQHCQRATPFGNAKTYRRSTLWFGTASCAQMGCPTPMSHLQFPSVWQEQVELAARHHWLTLIVCVSLLARLVI
jgi:hypothetical protein